MQRQYDNSQNYKHQYRKHCYSCPMTFAFSNNDCFFLHFLYLLISIRQIQVLRTVRLLKLYTDGTEKSSNSAPHFHRPLHFWLLAYDRGGGIFVCIGIPSVKAIFSSSTLEAKHLPMGVGSGSRMQFARNASPRTTSLVTFLFGYKNVTLRIGSLISSFLNALPTQIIYPYIN